MKRTALTSLVFWVVGLGSTLAYSEDLSSVTRGGRLYDNFSAETKSRAPNHPNPIFKTRQVRVAAADTWRCVSCHGWDYRGSPGVPGVNAKQKATSAAIIAILKDANHGFEELLDDGDRMDLANFITQGQVDMHKLVDAARLAKATPASEKMFATICANCHGFNGDRLRQIPPLGDVARRRPYEVLHTVLNGHPGGNMPALRTLGEDTAVRMLGYLETLPSVNLAASIANGGRLYDDWQVHSGGQRQALPHPAYPSKAYYANVATETWRCTACHGWDYKGNQGRYASGKNATGIKGIRAQAGGDPVKVMEVLRSSSHLFGAVLKYRDLQDLANFVSFGQIDMDSIVDPRTGAARGDAARGFSHYRTMCAACHGQEGRFVGKRFIGRLAKEDPWHAVHNMLNGHPDDNMPALRELDPKVVGDILAHMQTLKERP